MLVAVEAAINSCRYPQWIQDIVVETEHGAQAVAKHEAWFRFSDGTIPQIQHQALLVGFWPLIERFPQFLALNLLKCSYGEQPGLNTARGWLINNLRIEQRHVEMYEDWAQCAGIPRKQLFNAQRSKAAIAVTDWCWHVCQDDGLAEAMAATSYAIEGVTAEWTKMVWESPSYKLFFAEGQRKKAMKWIQAHAAYDETHPVDALDLIYNLLGDTPDESRVQRVKHAIQKSYDLYLLGLDTGMAAA
ncbi:TenA family transcriptional regulator [Candidatus Nitrospira salsa]